MFLPVWCGENVGLSTRLINTQRPGDLPEAPRLQSSSDSLCHLSQGRDWPTDPPVSLVEVRFLEGGQVSAGLAHECWSHGPGCTFVMTNPKATAFRAAGGGTLWGDLLFPWALGWHRR